jgi:hypothetical protein
VVLSVAPKVFLLQNGLDNQVLNILPMVAQEQMGLTFFCLIQALLLHLILVDLVALWDIPSVVI